jgi:hypothetical protein
MMAINWGSVEGRKWKDSDYICESGQLPPEHDAIAVPGLLCHLGFTDLFAIYRVVNGSSSSLVFLLFQKLRDRVLHMATESKIDT